MRGARLRRACANEWRLRDDARGTPKGWHEARIGNRSITRKALAWPAPGDERRFVLESRPAVALRCDPKSFDGLTLQHNPILPMITRWTLPMPDGFFNAAPLKGYIAGRPRNRFVRISEVFANRSSLMKSAFYRRYMAPQGCLHAVGLFFWKDERLICVIAIMRTARQGDLSPAELKMLRQLYTMVLT